MFGARINIRWEGQLVDPPTHYITVNPETCYFYIRVFNDGTKKDLKPPINTLEGAMDVVSSLCLMKSHKKDDLLSGLTFFPGTHLCS